MLAPLFTSRLAVPKPAFRPVGVQASFFARYTGSELRTASGISAHVQIFASAYWLGGKFSDASQRRGMLVVGTVRLA